MNSELESRIRQTGYRLYDLMEGEAGSIFSREYWVGKLFEWCMNSEPFKVQMLRFIDVFPYLRDTDAVIGHIQQYFSDPTLNFPSAVNWGIKYVAPSWMTSRIIAGSIGMNIAKVARQFIAGTSAKDSLPVLEKLRSSGLAFSIDLLGEAVVSEKEADGYAERYLQLFEFLDSAQSSWRPLGAVLGGLDWGHSPRVNVSIKPSAMYSQMNACAFEHSIEKSKERLRPILRRAVKAGAFVNFDMEHHGLKDLTFALHQSIMEEAEFGSYPHTGIVIQAYLRESEKDLERIIRWANQGGFHLTVRLVKGAYWDQEVIVAGQRNWPVPVFAVKSETDANFEHLARIILQNSNRLKLACASHNIRSISAVVEMAKEAGVAGEQIEFQVLYGMGQPVRNALHKAGLHVRVYCPVGEMLQGMAYLVRRLLENTANQSFLRQTFSQRLPKADLLRNPVDKLNKSLPGPPGAGLARHEGPPPESVGSEIAREAGHGVGPFTIEPVYDWSRSEHRRQFAAALNNVRERFPIQVPLQIGGYRIQTASGFASLNPNDSYETVGTVCSADIKEAELAIAAAKSAFPQWRDTPAQHRADCLFKAAASARLKRRELAALQVLEVGKTWSEADADVCEAIDYLEYYGREMLRRAAPRPMGQVPGETSFLLYEPRGVAVVIAPWNFPMAISTGMSSAAIVTGNTVVYKPASQSPVTGFMLNGIFEEAGLPRGVFNFVPGPGSSLGDVLTAHPDVALIAFTGSRDVGLHILAKAHENNERSAFVKNVVLEMGGKNAIIVDSDADLDEAVVYALHSAFGYQGQKCSACSRLIVVEDIYDRFVERLKAAAQSIGIGPVEFPQNFMGAVIEQAARDRILGYVEMGKNAGYPLFELSPVGRNGAHPHPAGNGWFVPLSIFTDVDPESRLAQEEIFGPVLAVIKVKDFDEALRVANGTQYALTGGVLSRSPANIRKARENFRTGNLYINRGCTGAVVGRHPFGGFKMSGLGSKAGGPDYLLHFMIARNIVENTVRKGYAPLEGAPPD
ncbi:MAG TPA: proline dehydrogenase family protein [Syntrophobacteraceae bacterium]|nr:proline dehydrogenase family protein [Syntrophobacteraceae bacterium]